MENIKLEIFLKPLGFTMFFSLVVAVIYVLIIIYGILFYPSLFKEHIWGLSVYQVTLMFIVIAVTSCVFVTVITKITKVKLQIQRV